MEMPLPRLLRPIWGGVMFAWKAWDRASRNNAGIASASIAFFGLLGLVPALTAVGLVCVWLADPLDVLTAFAQFGRLLPEAAAKFMLTQLAVVLVGGKTRGAVALISAVVVGLYGLMNAAQALVASLNLAYRLTETRGFIRLTLINLTIAAGFSGAAVGIVLMMLIAGRFHDQQIPLVHRGLTWAVFGATLALAVLVIAQIYARGPCRRRANPATPHRIYPGAVVAVAIALASSLGFGVYTAHLAHFTATYGVLGGVVPLMLWFQLCGYAVLLGAAVNARLRPGGHKPALPADCVPCPDSGTIGA